MKFLFVLILFFPVLINSQTKTYNIRPIPNRVVQYQNNISDGILFEDLSWAWKTTPSCFSKINQNKFNGKHIVFSGNLPKYSTIQISLTPKNKSKNLSLYAFLSSKETPIFPFKATNCNQCKSEYSKTENHKTTKKIADRQIHDITTNNEEYKLIIGVVGANRLENAEFTLKITMKTK